MAGRLRGIPIVVSFGIFALIVATPTASARINGMLHLAGSPRAAPSTQPGDARSVDRSARTPANFGSPRAASPSGPMAYHGGPVEHHTRIFLIFWGPKYKPGYKADPYQPIVSAQETLFSTLAHSSYNGILTQYYDTTSGSKSHITNDVSLSDVWIDRVAPSGAVDASSALSEVNRAISVNGWPGTINDQFIVLPQPGSSVTLDDSFCAEHFISNGGRIYSIIRDPNDASYSYCHSNTSVALSMTSLSSHEYAESATDPDGTTGWYDTNASGEIGDLCFPTSAAFGTVWAQYLYSNAAGGCVAPGSAGPGPKWSVQTSANPPGSPENSLLGVSCTSTTRCTAVGWRENSSFLSFPLAEQWNGKSWKIQIPPNPTDLHDGQLSGASCPNVKLCIAVGDYTDGTGTQVALAERWNGKSWSLQTAKIPTGATGSALSAVSCSSDISCTATGNYTNGSGVTVPLAESWNGTSWSLETAPHPSGATSSVLSGVSCPTATACTAVGQYDDGSGSTLTLAESRTVPGFVPGLS